MYLDIHLVFHACIISDIPWYKFKIGDLFNFSRSFFTFVVVGFDTGQLTIIFFLSSTNPWEQPPYTRGITRHRIHYQTVTESKALEAMWAEGMRGLLSAMIASHRAGKSRCVRNALLRALSRWFILVWCLVEMWVYFTFEDTFEHKLDAVVSYDACQSWTDTEKQGNTEESLEQQTIDLDMFLSIVLTYVLWMMLYYRSLRKLWNVRSSIVTTFSILWMLICRDLTSRFQAPKFVSMHYIIYTNAAAYKTSIRDDSILTKIITPKRPFRNNAKAMRC